MGRAFSQECSTTAAFTSCEAAHEHSFAMCWTKSGGYGYGGLQGCSRRCVCSPASCSNHSPSRAQADGLAMCICSRPVQVFSVMGQQQSACLLRRAVAATVACYARGSSQRGCAAHAECGKGGGPHAPTKATHWMVLPSPISSASTLLWFLAHDRMSQLRPAPTMIPSRLPCTCVLCNFSHPHIVS